MDAISRQFSFMDDGEKAQGLGPVQGGAEVEQGGSREAAAPLLEIKPNTVDKPETWEKETVEHVLVSCSCRSRFCPDCSTSQGIALRIRVKAAISHWKSIQMWTLTLNPENFQGIPCEAFDYVRQRKAISEWVKALRKAGYLQDRHYFCVVEWQKDTEFPHWHILLQTKNIPHAEAARLWNRNFKPEMVSHVQDEKEREERLQKKNFGYVFFSKSKAWQNPEHAANYATKYCIKYPEEGFPDWVLDYYGRIDRYQVSQGFWSVNRVRDCEAEPEPVEDTRNTECDLSDTCDCPFCRGDEPKHREQKTQRERIEKCAQRCSVLLKRRRWDSEGKELKPDYSYAFSVDMPYDYASQDLPNFEHGRETVLTHEDYTFFRELMGIEDDSEHYTKFDPSLLWRQDGAHYNGPNYREYVFE